MCFLFEVIVLVAVGATSVLAACDTSSPYRTFDGSCNNLQNPTWGMANTPYGRLLPAEYGDGIITPRRSRTGVELPSARLLSLRLFNEQPILDPRTTLVNMQFGQIVAHDMGLRASNADPVCCQNGRIVANPSRRCYSIVVPPNDPVLAAGGVQCLDLVRTLNTCDVNGGNCGGRQAQQLNSATSFLDLSLVYGNSAQQNAPLRAFVGGRMKVENRNGTDWPPRNPQSGTACTLNLATDTCYLTGDERSNITPELTILQIVLLREHNRIAQQLSKLRPLWNDEKVFQEARRINIAQYQHIVYYEWLPYFLGPNPMVQRGLLRRTCRTGYVNDYNALVNPTTLNSHANGAFRYFHSAILGRLRLHQESRAYAGELNINDHMFNPTVLERSDGYSMLTRGMTTQPMGRNDLSYDPEMRHFLFRFRDRFGSDLKALDIQRSRDHGIAGYNAFRQYCGLGRASRWEDFTELRGPMNFQLLNSLYRTVDDVDLTVAEFFERHLPGTQAGPTYHCILIEQFLRTRRGDRFFFENGNSPGAFTPPQLNEIRKASMARLLCDNSPNVAQMQPRAFQQVTDVNPLVSCRSLSALDVRFW